jgi:predicted ATPase
VLVNQIVTRAGLPYQLNAPKAGGQFDAPFELRLTSSDGLKIDFGDLSSGEKVLMALGLAAYNSAHDDVRFPGVLLLDEPDAHLHPSMTRQMLDVLLDVFVRQRGVKVILTTHSPSTVALAPEECLYVMSKIEPRLSKTTKDGALALLTSGVPSLRAQERRSRPVTVDRCAA